MIVDTHVHPIADDRRKYPQIKDRATSAGIRTVTDIGQPEWPPFNLAEMIAAMDESGIDKATLVQAYYTYQYDNSYAIDCAKAHPDRFVVVCLIDEVAPESPDLLTDLVRNHLVRGWRMMGAQSKGFFADPRKLPLWKRAEELGIPILMGARIDELADLKGPIERHTGIPVIIEHSWANKLGTPLREFAKPLLDLAKLPHVHLKISTPMCHSWREAGSNAREFFGMLVDAFGAHRMMWGSNYPAHWHKQGKIKERVALMKEDLSFLSADDQRLIFGDAALSVWPDLK